VFGERLPTGSAAVAPPALPRAGALLTLARRAQADGDLLDPAHALPLYLRDKVALTTSEREAARHATATPHRT
jgi:tRNA threonylcarbamoyladenosine biosynthesis protein TsaB